MATWTTTNTIVIHFSRWTWLHHHLIQFMSQSWKQPRLRDFLNRDKNRGKYNFLNLNCETKQGYDKKTHSKLMLNILKTMGNYTFTYTPWALSFRKFLKKLEKFTCGPCSPMCINVHPCVNYEWTKTQLIVN
jgi:hypothetical protein